jgi:UDP-N-acetylmuramoyl-L-alanyl-D-glutamate--2,6-diaminopimelate ligase
MIRAENGSLIYIDYAHTPDAIRSISGFLSDMKENNKRLICLFGCGGNRDKTKRPKMAKEALKNSDILIITSDNPRDERPAAIIKDIKKGIDPAELRKCFFIEDRYKAIKKAISIAQNKDIVLIAGKGHEDVQIIGKRSIPFSDYKTAKSILNEK